MKKVDEIQTSSLFVVRERNRTRHKFLFVTGTGQLSPPYYIAFKILALHLLPTLRLRNKAEKKISLPLLGKNTNLPFPFWHNTQPSNPELKFFRRIKNPQQQQPFLFSFSFLKWYSRLEIRHRHPTSNRLSLASIAKAIIIIHRHHHRDSLYYQPLHPQTPDAVRVWHISRTIFSLRNT